MGEHPYWTKARLDRVRADVDAFEQSAFQGKFSNTERKKRMAAAIRLCENDDVRDILGRSVDYLPRRPAEIRRAIANAHSVVNGLRDWTALT